MPSLALARLVLMDVRRGSLPWLAAACVALSMALAAFLSQVALTESLQLQAAVAGAVLRAAAIFLVATQVVSSTLRESNDKSLELMLALPISRASLYLGRLAGYALCSAAVAMLFALPVLFWAPPAVAALWAFSLALECTLVCAAALFFSLTLTQFVGAIAATFGWYLLARAIGPMQAIASGPLAVPSFAHEAGRWTVEAVAMLLPRLDSMTKTEWLLYGAPAPQAYLGALSAALVYLALLVAAGLFDLHRRNA